MHEIPRQPWVIETQLLLGIASWMPPCPWLAVKVPQAGAAFNYNCRRFEWHYKTGNPPHWQTQLQKAILAFPALLISWSHYWISSTAIRKDHCFIFYVSRTRLLFLPPFQHINWREVSKHHLFMYFSTVLDSLLISQKSTLPTSATAQQQSAPFVSTSKEHFWEWDYSHAFGLYFFYVSELSLKSASLLLGRLTFSSLPSFFPITATTAADEMAVKCVALSFGQLFLMNHHRRRDSCAVPCCAFNACTAPIMIKSFGFHSFIVFSSFPAFFTTCGAEIKMLFGWRHYLGEVCFLGYHNRW